MEVVCIYSCDEWKSRSSMRLICVASIENYKRMLEKIQNSYRYTYEDMQTYIFTETFIVDDYD